MIRKFVLFSLSLGVLFLASFCAFAQENIVPEIVYVEGSVQVQIDASWHEATVGLVLNKKTIIKTGDNSYCDIAFDKGRQNIASIGPNSEVTAGEYFQKLNILKGRVFTKLDNLAQGSTFEVVTPVGIAGARGTAWETVVDTIVKFIVFERTINVQGLDSNGDPTENQDVSENFSIIIDTLGQLGEMEGLSSEEKERLKSWAERIKETLTEGKTSSQDLNNLLAELLGEEMGGAESFAAEGSGFQAGFGTPSDVPAPDLLGEDITQGTFTPKPDSSESDQNPPIVCGDVGCYQEVGGDFPLTDINNRRSDLID